MFSVPFLKYKIERSQVKDHCLPDNLLLFFHPHDWPLKPPHNYPTSFSQPKVCTLRTPTTANIINNHGLVSVLTTVVFLSIR